MLDDIDGIGPKRKKQLLKHFGSMKRMREATLEEFRELGIPERVAMELHEKLHDNGEKDVDTQK